MASFTYGSSTTNIVWDTWIDNTSTSATTLYSTNVTDSVWTGWMATGTGSYIPYTPAVLTEEQLRIQTESRKLREAANKKALELLRESLDEVQCEEYERDGYFHVETREGTRRYRLAPGSQPRRVHGEDGKGYAYCIHPDFSYPSGDVTLAQKLLLESDEDRFLSIANARPVTV